MTLDDCVRVIKMKDFWKVNDIDTIKGIVMRVIKDYEECLKVIDSLLEDRYTE